LEGTWRASEDGWMIRLPVRAEEVTVEKLVVVYEEAIIRRAAVGRLDHIRAISHRERLVTHTEGQVDLTDVGDEMPDRPETTPPD
jgi:stress response protein YsnF